MTGNELPRRRFAVSHPLVRGKVTLEPVVPSDGPAADATPLRVEPIEGPVTDGPLIRVGGPLIRFKMKMKPVEPAPNPPAGPAAVDPAG